MRIQKFIFRWSHLIGSFCFWIQCCCNIFIPDENVCIDKSDAMISQKIATRIRENIFMIYKHIHCKRFFFQTIRSSSFFFPSIFWLKILISSVFNTYISLLFLFISVCLQLRFCFHIPLFFFRKTFQKLRARYLELQKQQMVQLKANLKKRGVSSKLSGLTKKEWKKKRGRSRVNFFRCIFRCVFTFRSKNFSLTLFFKLDLITFEELLFICSLWCAPQNYMKNMKISPI